MKAFAFLFTIIMCILLQSTALFAQDYIVTVKNDTINCALQFSSKGEPTYTVNGQKAKVDTTSVIAYYLAEDSSSWVLKILPKTLKKNGPEQVYLKRLVKGKINLYEYMPNIYSTAINEDYKYYGHNQFGSSRTFVSMRGVGQMIHQSVFLWYVTKGQDVKQLTEFSFKGGGKITHRTDGIKEIIELLAGNPGLQARFKEIIDQDYPYTIVEDFFKTYNQQYLMSINPLNK